MIIRTLDEIINTERDVAWGNGQSRRFLLARDGVGFSVTDTLVNAGTESYIQYKNHLEACYCIEGEGEIEIDGEMHPIQVGSMYVLDQSEKHYLRATTDMRFICIFTPPINGDETHEFNGCESSY